MSETASLTPPSVSNSSSKYILTLMCFMLCALAYLIVKENPFPKILLILMALGGGFVFWLIGLHKPFMHRETIYYLLTAYLPFSKQIPGTFGGIFPGLNFTNLFVLILAYLWWKEGKKRKKTMWTKTSLNFAIFLFFSIGMISIFRGVGYGGGYLMEALMQYIRKWLIPFFLYFQIVNTVRDKETIKNIVVIIMMVTTIAALMAIYEYMNSDKRVGGILDQPNFLAAFFNYYIFLPFAFFLLNAKRLKSWSLLIPFLIQFRGIMVTFSRAGYLAFAAGLFAISCFRSKTMTVLAILGTVIIIMNPALLPEGIRYRMAQTFEKHHTSEEVVETEYSSSSESLDDSATERLKVWKGAIQMVKDHPIFGIGYYMFESKILHYWPGSKSHDAHNNYLLIAAEMGIPGILAFLWLIWRIFWNVWVYYRKTHDSFGKGLSLALLGGIPSLFISNIYGSRFNYLEVSAYLWILTALIMRLKTMEAQVVHE